MKTGLLAGFVVIFSSVYAHAAHAQTFGVSPALPTPDYGSAFFDLEVSGLSSPMDASFGLETVCLDITHDFLRDLTLWLVCPDGTEVLLSEKNGGSGDNYTNTCFDGNLSSTGITFGTPPFTGTFLPEQPLGVLNNGTINPNGTWQLKINDDYILFVGTLNSFSLTFGNSPAVLPPGFADGFED